MKYWSDKIFPISRKKRIKYIYKPRAIFLIKSLKKLKRNNRSHSYLEIGAADGTFAKEIRRLKYFKKYLLVDVNNIEDTKLQSKLARSYTDKHGLKDLIKEFVGIDISKQYQSSDFGGELSQAQIKYCANDVLYLHKINDALTKILKREKRFHLYEDCLKFINTRVNLDLASFSDDIWSH